MNRWFEFKSRLAGPPILADGGMGTELYARGVYINRCYDELNLSQPELVQAVHCDYIQSGACIIETNTYGANRFKLQPYGFEQDVEKINYQGARLARQAAEKQDADVFIVGSIGPLGRRLRPLGRLELSEAQDAFRKQAQGLLDGGVDAVFIETMLDPQELQTAVEIVRSLAPDVPIAAQFTLTDWDQSAYGTTIERMGELFASLPVDVVGFNCSLGPHKLLQAAERLLELIDRPLSLMPNAGELEWVEGRLICRATPEYFAEYAKRMVKAGVKIVGGCCGSTPAHIRAMETALRAIADESPLTRAVTISFPAQIAKESKAAKPYSELSPLAAAFEAKRFAYSVEISPPRSPVIDRLTARIKELHSAGVDAVNIPDGPRASARLSSMALAHLIRIHIGIDVIMHYTCRDRNILGIQSDLLGAEALGIDNILCVTGDPPKLGDYPMATAVFDVNSIGLLKIAANLNASFDLIGNPIPQGTTFHLGCGFDPGANDFEKEIDRLQRKLEAGAQFIMTQPVFDEELYYHFIDRLKRPDVPVMVGILPLVSFRNAEFYHNEVPGMQVPLWIREKLRGIDNKETAAEAGVEIAALALAHCRPYAAGAYIMPPFGRTELALAVISV